MTFAMIYTLISLCAIMPLKIGYEKQKRKTYPDSDTLPHSLKTAAIAIALVLFMLFILNFESEIIIYLYYSEIRKNMLEDATCTSEITRRFSTGGSSTHTTSAGVLQVLPDLH